MIEKYKQDKKNKFKFTIYVKFHQGNLSHIITNCKKNLQELKEYFKCQFNRMNFKLNYLKFMQKKKIKL